MVAIFNVILSNLDLVAMITPNPNMIYKYPIFDILDVSFNSWIAYFFGKDQKNIQVMGVIINLLPLNYDIVTLITSKLLVWDITVYISAI